MSSYNDIVAQAQVIYDSLSALETQITELQLLINALLNFIPQAPPPAPPPPPPPPGPFVVIENAYTDLITSEHRDKPKFLSAVAIAVQPWVDQITLLQTVPTRYDLDVCIGQQEDFVGQWVGIDRYLSEPITGVYFSFDTIGLGWDQGTWWQTFDPISELDALPDDSYRLLLRFKIAANIWDGTIPTAYSIFSQLFKLTGISILIQDNGDMSMIFALFGDLPNAITQELFTRGELVLRPAGVQTVFMIPSIANNPYFGFDVQNASISGWDNGSWGVITA